MAEKNTYEIRQDYITNELARPQIPLNDVKFLVAHETANNTADASAHQNYFNNIDFQASAHTFIDSTEILEIVPINEKAWHVRYDKPVDNRMYGDDANDVAIGVELCRTGEFDEAYARYVWYFAYLCRKFDLDPREHIVAHATLDPQRRTDPGSWLNPNGITWSEFIDDVQAVYDAWNKGDAKKVYEPKERQTKAVQISKDYKEYSIVDYLKKRGQDASFDARAELAEAYGIEGYTGSQEQNLRLLDILRTNPRQRNDVEYHGNSIVEYLDLAGIDSSWSNRKVLARKYGISNYRGSADQNLELLDRMRVGGQEPQPEVSSNAKYVTLPGSVETWRTYKLDVKPVKENSDWSLTPAAFGGLTYKILDEPYPNVVTIETSRGKRNIYVAPSTGAVIK